MRLAVRLTPRGGRDAIDGWASGPDGRAYLKARVSAPPVEVGVQEHQPPPVQPQPLPDPVADHEAGVEHRHLRVLAGHQITVQPDAGGGVAGIGGEVLASGHGSGSRGWS